MSHYIIVINCVIIIVSEAPKETVVAKKFPSYNPDIKTDQQKKEEVSKVQH